MIVEIEFKLGGTLYTASIDDTLMWDCNEDGIRRMLQSLTPGDWSLPGPPAYPSSIGFVLDAIKPFVPFTVTKTIETPSAPEPETAY